MNVFVVNSTKTFIFLINTLEINSLFLYNHYMKNWILKIITLVFLLLWMAVVFKFSHEPSLQSENTSSVITIKVINLISEICGFDETKKEVSVKLLNPYIRKFAHYFLYTIGGIFSIIYMRQYKSLKENKQLLISLIIGVLYAISDEIHQYFIPGRTCRIKDVYIDSLGIFTGIIFVLIITKIFQHIKSKNIKGENTNEYYKTGRG